MKSLLANKYIHSFIAFSSLLVSSNVMANTCSKADIDYYLQSGFNHDQVIKLCSAAKAAPAPISPPAPPSYKNAPNSAPAASAVNNQSGNLGQDQVFLSTALAAKNVKLTPQALSYDLKECVEYGYPNNPDLSDEACVNSRITISMQGLKVLKVSKGLFLVKDASLSVQGTIQREYINYNSVRRQEKEAIITLLPTNPSNIKIPVKRGIDPRQVADKIRSYSTL